MNDNYNFGEKITELRKIKRMKQKELADMLGIAPSVLSDYEHNRATPPLNTLCMICDIFNVQIDFFYAITRIDLIQYYENISSAAKSEPPIPICSFNNADGNAVMVTVDEEPAPGYIPDAPNTYFYLQLDDKPELFQFISFAGYLDAVLAVSKTSSASGIFEAAEKDGRIYFVKDNIEYTKEDLNIIAVPFIPIAYRNYPVY